MNSSLLLNSFPLLLQGALMTVKIAVVAMAIGVSCGVLVGILNCKKLRIPGISHVIELYILILRGTPMYVQVLLAYYVLPEIIGVNLSPFVAGVLALGCNSVAYVSEIVRGGINAIPAGQWDACHVLGYSQSEAVRFVIAPQALRNVLPSLVNELIVLVNPYYHPLEVVYHIL